MLPLPADSPASFALYAALLVGLVLVLAHTLRRVGFTVFEAGLVGASPLVAALDVPLFQVGGATIAVNGAGLLIPLVVTAKFLVEGRAPLVPAAVVTVVVTVVAYLASYAVPGRGVLLHYQAPALAACGGALVAVRSRFDQAGPVAFVSGTLGVTIGADAFRIHELVAAGTGSRIVIGGAGVIDGIFVVAMLAVGMSFVAAAAWEFVDRLTQKDPAAPPAA